MLGNKNKIQFLKIILKSRHHPHPPSSQQNNDPVLSLSAKQMKSTDSFQVSDLG